MKRFLVFAALAAGCSSSSRRDSAASPPPAGTPTKVVAMQALEGDLLQTGPGAVLLDPDTFRPAARVRITRELAAGRRWIPALHSGRRYFIRIQPDPVNLRLVFGDEAPVVVPDDFARVRHPAQVDLVAGDRVVADASRLVAFTKHDSFFVLPPRADLGSAVRFSTRYEGRSLGSTPEIRVGRVTAVRLMGLERSATVTSGTLVPLSLDTTLPDDRRIRISSRILGGGRFSGGGMEHACIVSVAQAKRRFADVVAVGGKRAQVEVLVTPVPIEGEPVSDPVVVTPSEPAFDAWIPGRVERVVLTDPFGSEVTVATESLKPESSGTRWKGRLTAEWLRRLGPGVFPLVFRAFERDREETITIAAVVGLEEAEKAWKEGRLMNEEDKSKGEKIAEELSREFPEWLKELGGLDELFKRFDKRGGGKKKKEPDGSLDPDELEALLEALQEWSEGKGYGGIESAEWIPWSWVIDGLLNGDPDKGVPGADKDKDGKLSRDEAEELLKRMSGK